MKFTGTFSAPLSIVSISTIFLFFSSAIIVWFWLTWLTSCRWTSNEPWSIDDFDSILHSSSSSDMGKISRYSDLKRHRKAVMNDFQLACGWRWCH
jgi:hypothetical protein